MSPEGPKGEGRGRRFVERGRERLDRSRERLAARRGRSPRMARPVPLLRRGLGVPWLFAIVYSSVGFSIYFAIGVVADRGLGLTPLIFLASGLLFILATLTYFEGGAMFLERGGSSTFARYAFNELVSFIAGWAILIDYLIVIALAAITVPHYLTPISDVFDEKWASVTVAAAVILLAAVINIRGVIGRRRQRLLVLLALGDLALQLAVIAVGAAIVFDPELLTAQLDLFSTPDVEDVVYAIVLATVAYAGIEAASNLAPDIQVQPRDLRRVVSAGALLVPLVYTGMAAIALMAVPVTPQPGGPETELAGRFVDAPVLGVVASYDPGWVADVMRWAVALVAAPTLAWAANTSMLGLSRHTYTLATNRQIPSWLGKLGRRFSTPFVAIWAASLLAMALVIPEDIKSLAAIYAFGATLAIAIAHLSVIRLRIRDPDRARPYRIPFNLRVGGASLPVPAIFAAVISILAFVSVIAFHDGARYVGGGWMVFGLVSYVIYRRLVEGTSLTKRVSVPAEALTKQEPELEYANILVPVFDVPLDDDIVSTAGRLADADAEDARPPKMVVLYVAQVPLSLPLDAAPPAERREAGSRALARAEEIAEEYEGVDVETSLVVARSVGAGIVEEARRRETEVIVMAGQPPSRVRGGGILGGIPGARPPEVSEITEYVLKRAPCRVLLTAPPAEGSEPGPAEGAEPEPAGNGA